MISNEKTSNVSSKKFGENAWDEVIQEANEEVNKVLMLGLMSMDDLKAEIKKLEGKRYLNSPLWHLPECYEELSKRLQGKKVKVVAVRGDDIQIRLGEVHGFVAIEAGIFSDPYTTIRLPSGKTLTGHSYRFEIIE